MKHTYDSRLRPDGRGPAPPPFRLLYADGYGTRGQWGRLRFSDCCKRPDLRRQHTARRLRYGPAGVLQRIVLSRVITRCMALRSGSGGGLPGTVQLSPGASMIPGHGTEGFIPTGTGELVITVDAIMPAEVLLRQRVCDASIRMVRSGGGSRGVSAGLPGGYGRSPLPATRTGR